MRANETERKAGDDRSEAGRLRFHLKSSKKNAQTGYIYMAKLRAQWDHVKAVFQIRRHFKNPWLITLLRLGLIKLPYFPYRIQKGPTHYTLLARPSSTAMGDLFVLKEVLLEETYRDVLPLLNKKDIRLVDIGANLGSFTLWISKKIGIREAFCFEPEADSFQLLNFNFYLNDLFAAKTLECAVGGEERTIKLALRKANPAATSIYEDIITSPTDTGITRSVPVVSLANWSHGVDGHFDLLKVDCEGAEWEIVRKTDPQIFTRFGVIVAEVHDDPEHKQPVSEFKKLVEHLGYRTVRSDDRVQGLYIGVRNDSGS